MKAADSHDFLDMVQNARSFQAKCSTGVKMFEFESLIRKIQKFSVRWKTVDRNTK